MLGHQLTGFEKKETRHRPWGGKSLLGAVGKPIGTVCFTAFPDLSSSRARVHLGTSTAGAEGASMKPVGGVNLSGFSIRETTPFLTQRKNPPIENNQTSKCLDVHGLLIWLSPTPPKLPSSNGKVMPRVS
jgi:hypothetical protein